MENLKETKKYIDILIEAIYKIKIPSINIMEIWGGQTHALAKYRIESLHPKTITMIHGPGCPVCITPEEKIDLAYNISLEKNVIFASFGDMVRVPGSSGSLLEAKSFGADLRIIYSTLDVLRIAEENPKKEIVFFSIGFETTAPIHALTIREAQRRELKNLSFLNSLVRVPPALELILDDKDNCVNGILGAGHVCAITGYDRYKDISKKYKIPISITGFDAVELLTGIYNCVKQYSENDYSVSNSYRKIVNETGNYKSL